MPAEVSHKSAHFRSLRLLRFSSLEPGAHRLLHLAYASNFAATVRSAVNQGLQLLEHFGHVEGGSHFRQHRLYLRENSQMFPVCRIEHLETDRALVYQR